MGKMLGNTWTTVLGFVAGVVTYLQAAGPTLPKTKQDWAALLLGALLAGLGLVAKDAQTGSAPK